MSSLPHVHVEPLNGNLFGADQPCFGCGPNHPIGFQLKFERDGDTLLTRFTPGPQYQGPLGIMHGGLVATLADEVAAWAVIGLLEKFGFTAGAEMRWKKPLRINVEAIGKSHIIKATSRVVTVGVSITQNAEECFAGDFKFVLVDTAGAESMMGGPIPESWKRFTR